MIRIDQYGFDLVLFCMHFTLVMKKQALGILALSATLDGVLGIHEYTVHGVGITIAWHTMIVTIQYLFTYMSVMNVRNDSTTA